MKNLLKSYIKNAENSSFQCSCGKKHSIDIENIIIRTGAIDELPNLLRGRKRIFLIADNQTYSTVEEKLEFLIKDIEISKFVFGEEKLYPNLEALGQIILEVKKDAELILAVGSGTINDLCRMISYKLNIPYIIIGTAPSMDGYASVVSPIISGSIKSTYSASYPESIIGDLDVLSQAPLNMVKAGVGDILGKYTALTDWKISKVLNNEYYCDYIVEIVKHSLAKCIRNCNRIIEMESSAIQSLMEALILSGLAIGMTGSSRPASGEEHHMSHCFEAYYLEKGQMPKYLHGNYVGASTSIVIEAYKFFMNLDLKKIYNEKIFLGFDEEEWVDSIREMYRTNSDYIINFKKSSINFDADKRKERVLKIIENERELREAARDLIEDTKGLEEICVKNNICFNPNQLGIDKEVIFKSIISSKDIRNRYGVFQLLEDLGVLKEFAYSAVEK